MSLIRGPHAWPFEHDRLRVSEDGIELDGQPFPVAWVDGCELIVFLRKTALMTWSRRCFAAVALLSGVVVAAGVFAGVELSRDLLGTAVLALVFGFLSWRGLVRYDAAQRLYQVWFHSGEVRREVFESHDGAAAEDCVQALELALGEGSVQRREMVLDLSAPPGSGHS